MKTTFERYRLPLLLGLLFLSFYATLGTVPLFDLDEGAFSEATREMLVGGDYITTYLNGDVRFDKPILIYWLQAASVSLFGPHEWAFRLPSAVAATLWAAVIYRFGAAVFDSRKAFWATLFMVSSLQVSIIAKAAIADALLNLFIAVTMLSLYLHLEKSHRRYLYIAAASMALGVLTKGPVAVLIPVAVLTIHLGWAGEWRRLGRILFDPKAMLLFLAIAAPWYILEYKAQGMKFVEGFLLKHNVARFKTSFEGHSGSLLYYIPVILVGMLPFTTVFLKMTAHLKAFFRDPATRYLATWGLFVFLFFSLSGTKLPHYVIYGYTPFFIMMALVFDRLKSPAAFVAPLWLLFAALMSLPMLLPFIEPQVRDPFARIVMGHAHEAIGAGYYLFFAAGLGLLTWLARSRRPGMAVRAVVMAYLLTVGVNFFVLPAYAKVAQAPVKEAALLAKAKGWPVVMYGINMPSFIVYSQRLVEKRRPNPGDIVFTKATKLSKLGDYRLLFEKNGYVLARILVKNEK